MGGLLFTSNGSGLVPETWKELSSVQNETPQGIPIDAMRWHSIRPNEMPLGRLLLVVRGFSYSPNLF